MLKSPTTTIDAAFEESRTGNECGTGLHVRQSYKHYQGHGQPIENTLCYIISTYELMVACSVIENTHYIRPTYAMSTMFI